MAGAARLVDYVMVKKGGGSLAYIVMMAAFSCRYDTEVMCHKDDGVFPIKFKVF